MIGAVSEQFSKFVSFAEEQISRGKGKAIATKGDIVGGTKLEERKIAITNKTDWVGLVLFRSGDTKAANNEVRDLFKKTIVDMFGGEQNIPDSVKTAMLMKDYGCGKPLTARRIIAVRNAIANLGRVNCFDKTNDPHGQLAKKAVAAGYTRLDFGRLNTAANHLVAKNGNMSYEQALDQVIAKGSAANRAMNAGSLYMKSADDFARGMDVHGRVAADDVNNVKIAKQFASKESAGQLVTIAENLEDKFTNLLHDAEQLHAAAKLPHESLDEVRKAVEAVAKKFKAVKDEIASGKLSDRKDINDRLFHVDLADVRKAVEKVDRALRAAGAQNPAVEEFRRYIRACNMETGEVYDELANAYKEAVASDMAESMKPRLIAAAQQGGMKNNSPSEIPAGILNNLTAFLGVNPFARIANLEKFCDNLEKYGSANLRFSDAQKNELRQLVDGAFGKGPKADRIFKHFVEQFETSFFAEQMLTPTDFGKNQPKDPEFVVKYFRDNPTALGAFDPGFKLDTEEDVEAVKGTIQKSVRDDLNSKLKVTDAKKETSLVTGLMPQAVREYTTGYVTFKGEPIPNAELGTNFPQLGSQCDTPMRKGYAEFLEKTFGAGYTKMRQTVSFVCGMANGLGGAIDSLIEHGDEKSGIKSASRDKLKDMGLVFSSGGLTSAENYNIEFTDTGDVKITLTHLVRNAVNLFMDKDRIYTPKLISGPNATAILGSTKVVVTMTIKNVADADLGADEMPEFSIDDIHQEMA